MRLVPDALADAPRSVRFLFVMVCLAAANAVIGAILFLIVALVS
jgi:hypothetical protein